ncbi:MAG: hypothetical protein HC836_44135 [Richelia sp. RM2_1_2]|nr:hypothetical protein [Richelia sp. RM2_1_2]
MTTYQQQKQKLLQLFQQTQAIAKQYKYPEIEQNLKESAQHLAEGKLIVVVCGEFKQGKSSLINALINETNLFPVDVDITTNLVSSITYGEQEKITVVIGEPGKGQTKEIKRDEIPDYVTEQHNANNAKKAQMLIIQSPNPQLKEGLVLVDTPGVGGLNTDHTAVAYAFIPNADVILFVSDAQKPLTEKELEFVEMIARHCQNLIFVVTKKDIGNYQEIIESNREKLNQTLNTPGEEITIIPVSSKIKLNYLKSQDQEDLEDSNFTELENQVWQILNQKGGYILVMRAVRDLGQAIAQIKTPLQKEWEAYQKTPDEVLEMERQFEQIKQRLQNLQNNKAAWQTQLNDGLQDIKIKILDQQCEDGFAAIRNQTQKYLDNPSLLEEPQQIISLLEVDIDSLMSNLGQELSNLAATLYSQIESSTELDINLLDVDSLTENKVSVPTENIQFKTEPVFKKVLQVTRNASFSGSAAGTIGGLIGGTIGTFFGGIGSVPGYYVGAAIGLGFAGIAGLVTGGMEALSQQKERNRMQSIKIFSYF